MSAPRTKTFLANAMKLWAASRTPMSLNLTNDFEVEYSDASETNLSCVVKIRDPHEGMWRYYEIKVKEIL